MGRFCEPSAGTVTAFPQRTEIFVECRSEQRTNCDRIKNTNERSELLGRKYRHRTNVSPSSSQQRAASGAQMTLQRCKTVCLSQCPEYHFLAQPIHRQTHLDPSDRFALEHS